MTRARDDVSKRSSADVRVVLGETPLRQTIDVEAGESLNVCVEGTCVALRVKVDDEVVLDRPLTEDERAAGSARVSLDPRCFQRAMRFSTVTVEVRDDSVDHHRGSVVVGSWRLVASVLVRGARARAVTHVVYVSLIAAIFWSFAATSAGSFARVALDVACVIVALASCATVRWPGGPLAPVRSVASVALVLVVSALSISQTTSVMFAYASGSESGDVQRGTQVRFVPGDVEATGDGVVRIRGRSWHVEPLCTVDRRVWSAATGGTRRLVVSDGPRSVVLERAAVAALGITDRVVVDCVDGAWLTLESATSARAAATAESERLALPLVRLSGGPRVRLADLHWGAPRPIAVHAIGTRPKLELFNTHASNVRLEYELPLDVEGLWAGALGEGWRGAVRWMPHAADAPFVCEPGANTIVTADAVDGLIEAIDGANFHLRFNSGMERVACVVDDGRSFGERSSVTIALRRDRELREQWSAAGYLDADWRTIRWVHRVGAHDELLAETFRVAPASRGHNTVQHVELLGALADATEITLVRRGVRSTLWRREVARPVQAVVNVAMGELLFASGNAVLVRVGDGPLAREVASELLEMNGRYQLAASDAPPQQTDDWMCGYARMQSRRANR